eukprot:GHVT01088356.1.p1 GENE.GHVT01088356.1~~GHVT01088356.1.p1  ORF type:complete len:338 (-),score=43.48 GHVT01088356.1:1912-2925(-)
MDSGEHAQLAASLGRLRISTPHPDSSALPWLGSSPVGLPTYETFEVPSRASNSFTTLSLSQHNPDALGCVFPDWRQQQQGRHLSGTTSVTGPAVIDANPVSTCIGSLGIEEEAQLSNDETPKDLAKDAIVATAPGTSVDGRRSSSSEPAPVMDLAIVPYTPCLPLSHLVRQRLVQVVTESRRQPQHAFRTSGDIGLPPFDQVVRRALRGSRRSGEHPATWVVGCSAGAARKSRLTQPRDGDSDSSPGAAAVDEPSSEEEATADPDAADEDGSRSAHSPWRNRRSQYTHQCMASLKKRTHEDEPSSFFGTMPPRRQRMHHAVSTPYSHPDFAPTRAGT